MLGPGRFSSWDLKLAAMGAMALDHLAFGLIFRGPVPLPAALYVLGTAMRLVGRVAFPLYGFLLVQGFFYTRSRAAYLKRLFFFALVSEIPYNLLCSGRPFYPESQNTLWTLSLGLLALWGVRNAWAKGAAPAKSAALGRKRTRWLPAAALLCTAALAMGAAYLLRTDYGALGVLFILALYFFDGRTEAQFYAGGAVLVAMEGIDWGLCGCIAFFFISRYNGDRGRRPGILAYLFYPVHLLIIYCTGVLIHGIYF